MAAITGNVVSTTSSSVEIEDGEGLASMYDSLDMYTAIEIKPMDVGNGVLT